MPLAPSASFESWRHMVSSTKRTSGITYVNSLILKKNVRITNSIVQCPSWINKFPAFYGTRRFITAFTWARHLSLSWNTSIQIMPPFHFLIDFSIILLSTHRFSPSGSFPQDSPTCNHLFCLPYTPLNRSISCLFIWSPRSYLLRSTDHKAPCYVVFSIPLLPRPTYDQISSSAPYSRIHSATVTPPMWATKFQTHAKQKAPLTFSIFYSLDLYSKLENKGSAPKHSKHPMSSVCS
jgi:hypothetical protein